MRLPFGLDLVSFLAGALFVAFVSFLVFVVRVWWKDATSPFRPQAVAQLTKKTPWQVVVSALGAVLQYVGAALIVAAVLLLVIFGFSLLDVRTLGLVGIVVVAIGTLTRAIA